MAQRKKQEPETDELAAIEWTDEPLLAPGEVELGEDGAGGHRRAQRVGAGDAGKEGKVDGWSEHMTTKKEELQRHYSQLRHDLVAFGPDDSDEPELDAVWRALYESPDEIVREAAAQIIVTYRIAGGNRDALAADWEIVRGFAER
jgi:hypothetical protein